MSTALGNNLGDLAASIRTPRAITCRRCGDPLQPCGSGNWRGVHGGRGLCLPCRSCLRAAGGLADYERLRRSRDDVLDDYEILRSEGYTWRQCAERLGMTYPAFERAMNRARRDRDPRASRIREVWPPRDLAEAS